MTGIDSGAGYARRAEVMALSSPVGSRVCEEPAAGALSLPAVLHALSDETRLAVVRQIDSVGECSCGSFEVGVAKSTLSQHLRVLREAGVTRTRPDGTQRWLSLRRPDLERRFPGLLDVVLAAHTAETGGEPVGVATAGS